MVRHLLKQDDTLLEELGDLSQPPAPSTPSQPVKKIKLTAKRIRELIDSGTLGGK
jgi:hypothetical protein